MLFFHFSKSISICNMNKFILRIAAANKLSRKKNSYLFSIKSIICLHQILFFFFLEESCITIEHSFAIIQRGRAEKFITIEGKKMNCVEFTFIIFFWMIAVLCALKENEQLARLLVKKKNGKERERKTDSVNNKLNEWKINWSIKSMKL